MQRCPGCIGLVHHEAVDRLPRYRARVLLDIDQRSERCMPVREGHRSRVFEAGLLQVQYQLEVLQHRGSRSLH